MKNEMLIIDSEFVDVSRWFDELSFNVHYEIDKEMKIINRLIFVKEKFFWIIFISKKMIFIYINYLFIEKKTFEFVLIGKDFFSLVNLSTKKYWN
jgi:hypothetical protein